MKKEKVTDAVVENPTASVHNGLEIKPGTVYSAHYDPYNEGWTILGVSKDGKKVCTAGHPPTIALLRHCSNLQELRPATEAELNYRKIMYGTEWL